MLPAAIDRLVLAAASRRDDGRLRLWSLQSEAPADLELAEVGPGRSEAGPPTRPVAWALGQAGVESAGRPGGRRTMPAGAGLSSSAALECATATALADLHSAGLDRVAPGRAGRRAENEVVGVPSGAMDQMVSMLGRAGHACSWTRSLDTEQVPLPWKAAEPPAGDRHRAGHRLVDGAYADRRAACEAAAATLGVPALRDATPTQVEAAADALGEEGLRRARHVVTENARVLEAVRLLGAGELERLGPLLAASTPRCATTTRCPRPSWTRPWRRPWPPERSRRA